MKNEFGASSYPAEHEVTQEEKIVALLAPVLALVFWCLAPLGPFIIYMIKKDQSRFVASHALQATYFFGALWLASLLLLVVGMLLTCLTGLGFILYLLMFPIYIAGLVYGILAAVRAYEGKYFIYPVTGPLAQAKVG